MDRGNFITLKNGYRIWYEIVGSGKGIPLLTLHGGPGADMTISNRWRPSAMIAQ